MEMCGSCKAMTPVKLNLKLRSVLLLFTLLVSLAVLGYFVIAVWLLFLFAMVEIEVSCSTCGNSLYIISIWRAPEAFWGDTSYISICRLFKMPCPYLLFLYVVPFFTAFFIELGVAVHMYDTSMTIFNKHAIEWSKFEDLFVIPGPQWGPFDGPINVFETHFERKTFNYTGSRHIAVFLWEEWVNSFRCKCLSKSRKDLQIPDFCVCFANRKDDLAQCEFGSGDVPVIAGCDMEDLGYVENVAYVLCKKGWVRPVASGVFQCKDEDAGNFHWSFYPFF